MAIFAGSRYAGVKYTITTESGGEVVKNFMHIPPAPFSRGTTEIVLRDFESLETLAYQYGRDSRKWWLIATVNDLEWPLDLESGTKISMPF